MDHYYHAGDLGRFAEMGKGNADLWEKFSSYYAAVFAEGALTEREKALIALGVAHAVQCPYCIDAYTQDTLAKGCDLEQITEAVHVAAAIPPSSPRLAIERMKTSWSAACPIIRIRSPMIAPPV